jgi:hypothetical protein
MILRCRGRRRLREDERVLTQELDHEVGNPSSH